MIDLDSFEDHMVNDGEFLIEDAHAILRELREWRSGKRRVFWRVKSDAKSLRVQFDFAHKFDATHDALECINPIVYRVTVRPKEAKR